MDSIHMVQFKKNKNVPLDGISKSSGNKEISFQGIEGMDTSPNGMPSDPSILQ